MSSYNIIRYSHRKGEQVREYSNCIYDTVGMHERNALEIGTMLGR